VILLIVSKPILAQCFTPRQERNNMTSFYDIGGISDLTKKQLEAIASSGGLLMSTGYGYACPVATEETYHGFKTIVVRTYGMGNHGFIMLRGETLAAKAMLKKAWAIAAKAALEEAPESIREIDGVEKFLMECARVALPLEMAIESLEENMGGEGWFGHLPRDTEGDLTDRCRRFLSSVNLFEEVNQWTLREGLIEDFERMCQDIEFRLMA